MLTLETINDFIVGPSVYNENEFCSFLDELIDTTNEVRFIEILDQLYAYAYRANNKNAMCKLLEYGAHKGNDYQATASAYIATSWGVNQSTKVLFTEGPEYGS